MLTVGTTWNGSVSLSASDFPDPVGCHTFWHNRFFEDRRHTDENVDRTMSSSHPATEIFSRCSSDRISVIPPDRASVAVGDRLTARKEMGPAGYRRSPFPLVSIVIPVYNGSNYLREAIESALAQTYSPIEVIVVNDGSDDNGRSRSLAQEYGNRIRYVEKENGGVSSALNTGITLMRGEYFSWLSHDDIYPLTKVEEQIKFLWNRSEFSCTYGDIEYIDSLSRPVSTLRYHHSNPALFPSYLITDGLHGCSALIHRHCFDEVGGFREDLRVVQDHDMWLRIGTAFPFVHEPVVRVYARTHADQGSRNLSPAGKREIQSFYLQSVPIALASLGRSLLAPHEQLELLDRMADALFSKYGSSSVPFIIGTVLFGIRKMRRRRVRLATRLAAKLVCEETGRRLRCLIGQKRSTSSG